jgi:dTMP kinase
MKGRLITLEGIDGSGKSTQATLLADALRSRGYTVHFLREPGGTVVGERIRDVLLDRAHAEMTPLAELFLYLAARAQITGEIIIPALQRGDVVVMDRYLDSSVAYQGAARGLGVYLVGGLNSVAAQGLVPDRTYLVDLDPELAFSRSSTTPDRLESEGMAFMARVREGFLSIARNEHPRVLVLDGSRSIEDISGAILADALTLFR